MPKQIDSNIGERADEILRSVQITTLPVTDYVLPNEWCYLLRELEAKGPDMTGPGESIRRYQYLVVARRDREAVWRRDLGLASAFHDHGFNILGGVKDMDTGKWLPCHTVDDLLDLADMQRDASKPIIVEKDYVTKFNERYRDILDTRRLAAVHQSVSGPHITVERK